MSKILATSAILAALTATSAAQAQSLPSGWYVSVFAGASEIGSIDTDYYGDFVEQFLDTSYTLGLTIGRDLTPNIRGEIELSYSSYQGGAVDYNNGPRHLFSDGSVSTTYLLANAWYDFSPVSLGTGAFTPYAGGGIGAVFVSADTYFNGNIFGYGDDSIGLAYQVGAGMLVPMGNGTIDIGYRYKAASEFDLDDNDGGGVYAGAQYDSHNIHIGYMFSF